MIKSTQPPHPHPHPHRQQPKHPYTFWPPHHTTSVPNFGNIQHVFPTSSPEPFTPMSPTPAPPLSSVNNPSLSTYQTNHTLNNYPSRPPLAPIPRPQQTYNNHLPHHPNLQRSNLAEVRNFPSFFRSTAPQKTGPRGSLLGNDYKTILKNATRFFFANFPETYSYDDTWSFFNQYGSVCNLFISRKKDKSGSRFGFISFKNVDNVTALVKKLEGCRAEGYTLRVKLAKSPNQATPKPVVHLQPIHRKNNPNSHPSSLIAHASLNQSQDNWRGITFDPEDSDFEWLTECFVGVTHDHVIPFLLEKNLHLNGILTVKVTPMGGNLVLLKATDKEEIPSLIKDVGDMLEQWFLDIRPWSPTDTGTNRNTWIRCLGIPLHAWNEQFFKLITASLGKFCSLDNSTSKRHRFDFGRVLIKTSIQESINRALKVMIKGQIFSIRLIEECCANGEFKILTDKTVGICTPLQSESSSDEQSGHHSDSGDEFCNELFESGNRLKGDELLPPERGNFENLALMDFNNDIHGAANFEMVEQIRESDFQTDGPQDGFPPKKVNSLSAHASSSNHTPLPSQKFTISPPSPTAYPPHELNSHTNSSAIPSHNSISPHFPTTTTPPPLEFNSPLIPSPYPSHNSKSTLPPKPTTPQYFNPPPPIFNSPTLLISTSHPPANFESCSPLPPLSSFLNQINSSRAKNKEIIITPPSELPSSSNPGPSDLHALPLATIHPESYTIPLSSKPHKERPKKPIKSFYADLESDSNQESSIKKIKKRKPGRPRILPTHSSNLEMEQIIESPTISDGNIIACNSIAIYKNFDWEASEIWRFGRRIGIVGKGNDREIVLQLLDLVDRDKRPQS